MTVTSRGISFCASSNNPLSIPPYHIGTKIKAVTEEKSNEELPAGIGDDYSNSTLAIDNYLKMGDIKLR